MSSARGSEPGTPAQGAVVRARAAVTLTGHRSDTKLRPHFQHSPRAPRISQGNPMRAHGRLHLAWHDPAHRVWGWALSRVLRRWTVEQTGVCTRPQTRRTAEHAATDEPRAQRGHGGTRLARTALPGLRDRGRERTVVPEPGAGCGAGRAQQAHGAPRGAVTPRCAHAQRCTLGP